MTDEPPSPAPESPESHKWRGCLLGGLAFVASIIVAAVIGGLIAFETSDPSPTGLKRRGGLWAAAIPPLLLIGLPLAVAVYWRKIPGFVLGMALTIALIIVVPTGCVFLLQVSS